ncbi:MAG TPA: hypothetical protein VHM20_01270, partial [Gammaproteobacteria bacterium]|nr:hypothetical protein [Gammaproteobacteria bacterium]
MPFTIKVRRNRHFKFSSNLSHILPANSIGKVLIAISAFHEAIFLFMNAESTYKSVNSLYLLSNAYFQIGDFQNACQTLNFYPKYFNGNGVHAKIRILLELLDGREDLASLYIEPTANCLDYGWCPHQNMAARYPDKYEPTELDYDTKIEGLLFDAYNLLGQRVTHVGMGHLNVAYYSRALELQETLRTKSIKISKELKVWLKSHHIKLKDIIILSWEWVTQIGHLGMLDILFRMRKFGWWKGDAILLLPNKKLIANKSIISLFKDECKILSTGHNISHHLMRE